MHFGAQNPLIQVHLFTCPANTLCYRTTHQDTEETLSLAHIWHKDDLSDRLAPTCISWVSNQLIVTLIVCLLSKVHVARLRGCCCNYGNHTWREVFSFMHVLQTSPCKSAGLHSHQSNLPMY